MGEFAIGQSPGRLEDLRLLRGKGRYVEDVAYPNAAHGFVLRSPHAHATIRSIDATAAKAAPGVLAVLSGADYAADGLGHVPMIGPPVKRRDGSPAFIPPFPAVTADRARFVGDAVAFVVAETLAAAKDAAELIEVDYEPLPIVVGGIDALEPHAPTLWDDCPGNECFVYEVGDRAATDAAFENAAHVVRRRLVISRVLANAMESRGCIGHYDDNSGRYTVHAPIQHPFVARKVLAGTIFNCDEIDVRVVANEVGGSFGIKANIYPEYVLALWASKRTGRTVRWASERSEGHISDFHGRDNVSDAELALDGEGKFVGFRLRTIVNLGGYMSPLATGPATNNLGTLAGVYTTPASHVEVVGAFTNTHPTAPYRGAGRPEAAYVIERMIDLAAAELGYDACDLRRRNLIPPDAMPYKTALTFTYDSGEFERNMDDALSAAGRDGFEARRDEARSRGKLRGLGIANAIERAAPPGIEHVEIRFDPSGTATVLCGTTSQGQSHETMYAQVLCERLGIEADALRFVSGDTDRVAFGLGAGGSRCSALGTAALLMAADKVIDKGRIIAADMLETAEADVAFEDGTYAVAGTDRTVPFLDVVRRAFVPGGLADGIEPGLYESATYKANVASYPNGCHACEVEIDPDTGVVDIVRYVVVDDFGTVLNPLQVKGQVHGGVAQGAGQILMEQVRYDPSSGQILTGSFMDYAMPRADDLAPFEVESNPVPTATNPLGVKGAGEAGTVGALPAVMNGIIDALSPYGIDHLDMPASPERIWRAIRAAGAEQ